MISAKDARLFLGTGNDTQAEFSLWEIDRRHMIRGMVDWTWNGLKRSQVLFPCCGARTNILQKPINLCFFYLLYPSPNDGAILKLPLLSYVLKITQSF